MVRATLPAQQVKIGPTQLLINNEWVNSVIDEVIQRANATMYGLAAAVWTEDITKAYAIANNLRAGTV